jgi:hypothetical protein
MFAVLPLLFACSVDKGGGGSDDSAADDTGKPIDTGTEPQAWCKSHDFGVSHPWDAAGPYGTDRWSVAEDFTVPLADGTTWTLSEHWMGCESFLFVPDMARSGIDPTPVTTATAGYPDDLADLVAASPRNAHWFLFTDASNDDDASAANQGAADQVAAALASLGADDAAWWGERLHVVSGQAHDLDGWLADALHNGIGDNGMAIDRTQRLRGVGSLADVSRYRNALNDKGLWPWENNLAYAAYDAQHFEVEAATAAALDPTDLVIPAWQGEVISEYADMPIGFPSAEELKGYDRLLIDVDMRCPDRSDPEFGNCGAWDYIANVFVDDGTGAFIEISRMITSYHRETHWVVDASQMLPLLKGGKQTVRWSWAPKWNVQPTETWFSFRLGKTGASTRPTTATRLYSGGAFGSKYNVGRTPIDVPIPAGATKVELYAIITGHGAGTHQCAEFCNSQHEFTVNGSVYMKEDPGAGSTDAGCVADGIAAQATPNQWGTWWFGRGGWCPGQPVVPFVVDVTSDVKPGGTATVSYRGLYDGHTPDDGSGDIVLSSWLVVYE